jgi:hypothetical protein
MKKMEYDLRLVWNMSLLFQRGVLCGHNLQVHAACKSKDSRSLPCFFFFVFFCFFFFGADIVVGSVDKRGW